MYPEVLRLCEQVLLHFEREFGAPLQGCSKFVEVRQGLEPMTLASENYVVEITCLFSLKFDQIVYQLAHELFHVFVDPALEHVFVEILACAMSILILTKMHDDWKVSSDTFERSNAAEFLTYRNAVVRAALAEEKLDPKETKQVKEWASHVDLSCDERSKQLVLASLVCPWVATLNSLKILQTLASNITTGTKWRDSVQLPRPQTEQDKIFLQNLASILNLQ